MKKVKLYFQETCAGETYCFKKERAYYVEQSMAAKFVADGKAEYASDEEIVVSFPDIPDEEKIDIFDEGE